MPKIYFAGSVRGGRNDIKFYEKLIKYLKTKGIVLTEHIADCGISSSGEVALGDRDIYARDLKWLSTSDFVIAEVTNPSHGVGFEIAKAVELNKNVLCLYRMKSDNTLSAMISGCDGICVGGYETLHEAQELIDDFFISKSNN